MFNPFSKYFSTKFRDAMTSAIKDAIAECENMPDGAWVAMIKDSEYYSEPQKLIMREWGGRWKRTEDVFQAMAGILYDRYHRGFDISYLSDLGALETAAQGMEEKYATYQQQKELAIQAVVAAVLCDLYYQFDKDYE